MKYVSEGYQERLDAAAETACKRFEPVSALAHVALGVSESGLSDTGECQAEEGETSTTTSSELESDSVHIEPEIRTNHQFVFNPGQHDVEDIGWPGEVV